MATDVAFAFDTVSPYSYLAMARIDAFAAEHDARIEPVPVLLGGLFQAAGTASPLTNPQRARYAAADVALWAERLGVPLRFPAAFPTNTIAAQRAILAAGRAGGDAATWSAARALFAAYWGQGRDLSKPEVVQEGLEGAGLDGAALLAATQDPEVKEALKANTARVAGWGAFGVPSFHARGRLFFGNDRLDMLGWWLAADR